jgi:hypothetical protein
LNPDRKHRVFLQFLKRALELTSSYSKDDLHVFLDLCHRDYPGLSSLVAEYIRVAERGDTDILPGRGFANRNRPTSAVPGTRQMHVFDLLRDKRLFASNSDLAEFAGRILPDMSRSRFDKMSRGDIAARIIEYLETLEPGTRDRLEASMRNAVASTSGRVSDKKSFFSTWEKIIKGIQL